MNLLEGYSRAHRAEGEAEKWLCKRMREALGIQVLGTTSSFGHCYQSKWFRSILSFCVTSLHTEIPGQEHLGDPVPVTCAASPWGRHQDGPALLPRGNAGLQGTGQAPRQAGAAWQAGRAVLKAEPWRGSSYSYSPSSSSASPSLAPVCTELARQPRPQQDPRPPTASEVRVA